MRMPSTQAGRFANRRKITFASHELVRRWAAYNRAPYSGAVDMSRFTRSNPRPGNKAVTTLFQSAVRAQSEGHFAKAQALAKQVLVAAPRHADAMNLIGVSLYLQDDAASAESWLRKAIAIQRHPSYLLNLALVCNALGRAADAVAAYRDTLTLDGKNAQAWSNLGNLLIRSHAPAARQEAIDCYRQALRFQPGYPNALTNLGHALEQQNEYDEAEKHYKSALAVAPTFIPALTNLAGIHEHRKDYADALRLQEQALTLQPGNAKTLGSIVELRQRMADWDSARHPTPDDLAGALREDHSASIAPLQLIALPAIDAVLQREVARRFAHHRWHHELVHAPVATQASSAEGRRLRIGYLSADFRNHPVTHLLTDVITEHDRAGFEIFLYAYGPDASDVHRERIQRAADHFTVISQMDDLDAARRIAADGIDVLIELTGYTTHARMGITALRPAPVIASWLGFIGSLGEPRLADYVIGDAIATPLEHAAHFSEALAWMPQCFQPNQRREPLPSPPSRAEEGLPEDAVVFCSFNQMFKLGPALWDDWCRILEAVPGSVLWLAPTKSDVTESNLRQEAQRRGVAPQRILFASFKPLAQHQARIQLADLSLDTFPYNSGTTASDVLRAGVPLITLMGDRFAGRMAASLLHAIDMQELVADDRAGYVTRAIELGKDASRRQALRDRLATRVASSSLFDPARFARQLETLLTRMHAQALAGTREPLV